MMRRLTLAILLPLMLATPSLAAPGFPPGWGGSGQRPQDFEFGTEAIEGGSGKQAAYVKAKPGALPNQFGGMIQCIRADNYAGQRLRFAARLKGVKASAVQLWMRVDGPRPAAGGMSPVLAFYNMQDRPITGTTDWRRAEVVLDVPRNSAVICYGFFLAGGQGEAWADSLSLSKVGPDVPVSNLLPPEPANLGFDR
jgi:AraC family transcriptional regulator